MAVQRFTSINDLCAAAMEATERNPEDAAELALGWLMADEALLAAVTKPMLLTQCKAHCRDTITALRAVATHSTPSSFAQARMRGIRQEAHHQATKFLEFVLWNGRPLRVATQQEVQKQIEIYRQQVTPLATRRAWLTLVDQAFPDATTPVGDILDESRLAALHAQAQAAVTHGLDTTPHADVTPPPNPTHQGRPRS